ncbi:hypothetical protein AAVH_42866, partial [Aphelenchoides avenae]
RMGNNTDKPLYRIGLYEWLDKDHTKCLQCPNGLDEMPKIIKTAKYSPPGANCETSR